MIKLLNDKVTQKEIPEVACGSWASDVCGKDPEGCGFWSKDCCSITEGISNYLIIFALDFYLSKSPILNRAFK